ncbi:hypothetical protein CEXT_504801 [Caerostris extrusa]|uniref:Uncharacterized protein n=1 Tax=Caerostris extrusa TaxID=172846 RepID=A0AAV4TWU7_CAEEX|nr:hypothetical protein CEXT_504801 [Caerostris extrusa]
MTPTISCSPKYVNPVTFLITVVSLHIVDSQYGHRLEHGTNLRERLKGNGWISTNEAISKRKSLVSQVSKGEPLVHY